MIELELFLQILTIAGAVAGIVWKLASIKDSLQESVNKKIDGVYHKLGRIEASLNEARKLLALLESRHNADIERTNDRISALHQNSKSKIMDQAYVVNSLIEFLEKNEVGNPRFFQKVRDRETSDGGDENWTELRRRE
jgi:hypothetical protein